ncbi:MAG: hypothetical protein J6B75_06050 [Ruminococcus sp.]|nr:hypothetical protein [Ruminococcus sp.]
MTAKQFNSFIRLVLDVILEVIEKMQDGKEKEKLKRLADNLQKAIEN